MTFHDLDRHQKAAFNGTRGQHKPEAPCLASAQTSALSRLFGIVSVEDFEFQGGSFVQAAQSSLIIETVAARFDVVHASAHIVVAADLDLLGRVVGGIILAEPFVLERSCSLDPRTAQFAFDDGSAFVTLRAGRNAEVILASFDGTFVDDIVFSVAITIVQASAIVDATGRLDGQFLAANTGACEPEFIDFDRFTLVVFLAVLDASDGHQTGPVVDSCIADVDEIVLGDLVIQGDTSTALIHTADIDTAQFAVISLLAGEVVVSVFPFIAKLVLGTLVEAGDGIQRKKSITAQGTFKTVVLLVDRATDFEVFQLVGHASLGHNSSIAAFP
jgi:hypothetical protein